MKQLGIFFPVILFHLTACGSRDGAKGFLSDANICKPIPLEESNPIDGSSGRYAVPAPASGAIRIAQQTTPEVVKKDVWGVELYLSSLTSAPASFRMTVLAKRSQISAIESPTTGPDGQQAFQPFYTTIDSFSASLTPGWVKAQLPSAVVLEASDSLWLIADPTYSADQIVSWWTKSGSGAYAGAAASPLFVSVPGVQLIHRLVYCE